MTLIISDPSSRCSPIPAEGATVAAASRPARARSPRGEPFTLTASETYAIVSLTLFVAAIERPRGD